MLATTLYDAALARVRASRLTDVELIYTPSQIALAAFSLVAPDAAARWIAMKNMSESATLQAVLEEIQSVIAQQGLPPDVESVREVDRRLKLCKNPEKVVGSKAYLVRKKEEERIAEEKRTKKAELQKAAMNDEQDPFGTNLAPKKGLVDYDDDDDDDY